MRTLYSIGIFITGFVLKILARFRSKIKLGVDGRKQTFTVLRNKVSKSDKTIWMHCASLGEFEQGLPVLKTLRENYTTHSIVVSFFSPSGFENKKNTPFADVVVYLPMDTISNAKLFLDIVHPELILFVKYDIWPNMLFEIKKRRLKAILISASLRSNQSYFKWYGKLMRKSLFAFEHVFTQNELSKHLLNSINYYNVTISGDTRFDRVSQQLNSNNTIDFIEQFKNGKTTVVFGSTWPEDDKLSIPFINLYKDNDVKFIIAPHNINLAYSKSLKSQIKKSVTLYSEMDNRRLEDFDVFILDTIGYLSKTYSYADIAYVGGAAGKTGLHNILEPAVFGIPIIIGKNYAKFPEARELKNQKGVFSVVSLEDLKSLLNTFIRDNTFRKKTGDINKNFILKNKNATQIILNYLNKISL